MSSQRLSPVQRKLIEWFEESLIIQSIVTLLLVSTICALYLLGREVPSTLFTILGIAMTFWFSSKKRMQEKCDEETGLEPRQ